MNRNRFSHIDPGQLPLGNQTVGDILLDEGLGRLHGPDSLVDFLSAAND